MRHVTGEQIAQIDNPDPFAPPVWRSPVYRTPEGVTGARRAGSFHKPSRIPGPPRRGTWRDRSVRSARARAGRRAGRGSAT